MTLTVLFDLDDTLLNTNMGEFLPVYFKGLGQALSHLGTHEKIIEQVRVAVGEMVANQDPSKLLKEVFVENFYPALETTEFDCRDVLEKFYATAFPKLESLVTSKPEAETLVQWCKSQEMRLAIATNPLFPETATRQRIAWAGLDPKDFHFFSTYNNFHFTKPNVSYYAEVIGRLGWPNGPIVMVGDNLEYDLLPAEQMGLDTFWIDPEITVKESSHGPLSEVKSYLARLNKSGEPFTLSNKPEVLIDVLRSTPAVLNTWLEIYDRKSLHKQPAENEWSANQVFWHLVDFEERVYHPQWKQLLHNPDQIVPHNETNHWAEKRDYPSRDPVEACQRFLRSRMNSLEKVEALLNKGYFEITIQHTVFSEAKVSELVDFAVRHDRLHLRQCAEALKI